MKKITFLLLFICSLSSASSQLFVDEQCVEFFKDGSLLIEQGDYYGADSLLTLALCNFKNVDVYYNRAMARLLQKDTIGFCADISVATNKYFDVKSGELFNKFCCLKVDTVFYNKKFETISNNNYRYYEEIRQLKYDTLTIGTVHDSKAKNTQINFDLGCEENLLGVNFQKTDVIGVYVIHDSTKFFNLCEVSAAPINKDRYDDVKKKGKLMFKAKYNHLKDEYGLDELNILYSIMVTESGTIKKVDFISIYPDVPIENKIDDIEKDLLDIVMHYPKLKPAILKGKAVSSIMFDSLIY